MTNIIIKGSKDNTPERTRLEGQIAFILMKAGVSQFEIDACLEWAFGPDCLYLPIWPDWVDRFHKLHPKGPRIRRGESFVEIMFVIGFMYCVEKKKQEMKGKI